MVTALNILLSYLTCTDPVMVNKWNNILASFWHKDDGQVITEISTTQTEFTVKTKASDGTVTTNTVSLYQEPDQFPISKITNLQNILDGKVNSEVGKGLSSLDFTQALKDKLDSLQNYVHPEEHGIGEITGLQDYLDNLNDSLNLLNTILTAISQRQYVVIDGYRTYKGAANEDLTQHEAGDMFQVRGIHAGGDYLDAEVVNAPVVDIDTDLNIFNQQP